MTTETDSEAFNSCTEADRWIVEAAAAKHAARIGAGAIEAAVPLTAAQLIALSDRQRSVYRGALAYLSGKVESVRDDGMVWQPRSATWEAEDEAP